MNPVLLAAGATVISHNKDNSETMLPIEDFFLSYRQTSLPADAVITKIQIPFPAVEVREIMKAYKQAKRKDDDIAIVTAASRVRLDADGRVDGIALAFVGMAPTTVLASATNSTLVTKKWYDSRTLKAGLDALREEFKLDFGVPGGMATYRVTLALSFFFRFWHEVIHELGLGQVDKDLIEEIHRGISYGSRDDVNPREQRIVGKQIPHLSALKQTTGEAEYLGDIPHQDRELHGTLVLSQRAHANLVEVDWSAALGQGLAVGYVDKNDLPKHLNSWGSIRRDEPFFADGTVHSHGQVIGLVYAETAIQAQEAAKLIRVVYDDLPVILSIDEAIAANSLYPHGRELRKGAGVGGSMDDVFSRCDRTFEGVVSMGGQEHFYLETHAAMVIPHTEDGTMDVWSSTQNTMETQEFVSHVTGVPSNRINARVKRAGGAFGGKESRSVPIACVLAVAAKKEKRPIRCTLNRDEDMISTGQRHPFMARWKVGVMNDGTLVGLDADLYNNAGWSYDMSAAVMDR
jgi:xanthine dehydrogenase/oxidase